MATVYIGLGTNMGNRENNLSNALDYLENDSNIHNIKTSSIKETMPVDYLNQPHFLNQVICIETGYSPRELLVSLKSIEDEMGRKKEIPKGPRIIDLDILLYDDLILDTDDLKIPHLEIHNRNFILEHLIELSPELEDPRSKKMYKDLV